MVHDHVDFAAAALAFGEDEVIGVPSLVAGTGKNMLAVRDLMLGGLGKDSGLQTLREGRLPSSATVKRFGDENAAAVMVSYAPPVKKRDSAAPRAPAATVKTPSAPARTTP